MKKLLFLLFLTACGTEVDVTCPEAGCVPVNTVPTNTPTPAPVPKAEPVPVPTTPAPVPTVVNTPEPEDHQITFLFKTSWRESVGHQICSGELEIVDSSLTYDDLSGRHWLCNDGTHPFNDPNMIS